MKTAHEQTISPLLEEDDSGRQIINHPITKLRLRRMDGMWRVDFQRAPVWWFKLDKWFWFSDSVHISYKPAFDRYNELQIRKYYQYAKYTNHQVTLTEIL